LDHLDVGAVLSSSYSSEPLIAVSRTDASQVTTVIRHRVDAELAVSFGLFGWIEVGAGAPAVLYQSGDESLSSFALGDPWVGVRVALFPPRSSGFSLASVNAVTVPMPGERAFGSGGGLRYDTE